MPYFYCFKFSSCEHLSARQFFPELKALLHYLWILCGFSGHFCLRKNCPNNPHSANFRKLNKRIPAVPKRFLFFRANADNCRLFPLYFFTFPVGVYPVNELLPQAGNIVEVIRGSKNKRIGIKHLSQNSRHVIINMARSRGLAGHAAVAVLYVPVLQQNQLHIGACFLCAVKDPAEHCLSISLPRASAYCKNLHFHTPKILATFSRNNFAVSTAYSASFLP